MSLEVLRSRLSQIYESIQSFDVPRPQLPIIDLTSSHAQDNKQPCILGLRFLREGVRRDFEALNKLLLEHANPTAVSINAPYLIAVWEELVHARQPIAIYHMFSLGGQNDIKRKGTTSSGGKIQGKPQVRMVKVDVVAEDGARWIRVNTIKNARLMVEFHEIDSYLISGEDGEELEHVETRFDNSVLKMGRDLLAAAKANPIAVPTPFSSLLPDTHSTTSNPNDGMTPRVTICFTRLDPLDDGMTDPRIDKTIQCLRNMGINVQLGQRPSLCPAQIENMSIKPKLLEPTININLDLSALIALISDISHSPVPPTEEEARARFVPPQSYLDWKKYRAKLPVRQSQTTAPVLDDGEGDEDTWENSSQHSRALATQAIREMNKGILEEIRERLSAVVGHSSVLLPGVVFWTTSEARHRCLRIVSKIGGMKERQRAEALLGSAPCTRISSMLVPMAPLSETHGLEEEVSADPYWEHSRYSAGFLPLVPVHIYPSTLPVIENKDEQSRASFFQVLTQTCAGILSRREIAFTPQVSDSDSVPSARVLEEVLPAAQTSLQKLTIHTVRSLLAGASRGYTTLTTNRSSVKAVLKEMRRGRSDEPGAGDVEKAALWILDPRSLSEGMYSE